MVLAEMDIKIDSEITPEAEGAADKYKFAFVDQIKAADYTLQVINELDKAGVIPNDLQAVKETDVYRLRRGLCLPCAGATCIDVVTGERLIGDDDGKIKLGDIYKVMLPFHGRKDLESIADANLEKGWLFATPEGDLYHHVGVALARGAGIDALAVTGFKSIGEFAELLKSGDGALALSLDNEFVLDHTLKNNGDLVKNGNGERQIIVEGESGTGFRNFEQGRHVVSIVGMTKEDKVIVIDSFKLPQMQEEIVMRTLSVEEVDKYLNYSTGGDTRGILFAKKSEELEKYKQLASNIYVPDEVVAAVKNEIDNS